MRGWVLALEAAIALGMLGALLSLQPPASLQVDERSLERARLAQDLADVIAKSGELRQLALAARAGDEHAGTLLAARSGALLSRAGDYCAAISIGGRSLHARCLLGSGYNVAERLLYDGSQFHVLHVNLHAPG